MSKEAIRLTQLSKSAGWAAKIGPETLAQVLGKIPKIKDEKLIVGLDKADDAAVYKLNDEQYIIQTMDFFTPIVDNAYDFGQIAAANALSDVYAMGGEPILALNIVCFPKNLDLTYLEDILKGGSDKVIESKALLAGGHSVEDDEPKYGLSVCGLVSPENLLTNSNAKPGDILVLTKPIGTGIINTAIKNGKADRESELEAVKVMKTLNKDAKEMALKLKANACTDITGFGLLGHCIEMAENSEVTFEINIKDVPIINKTREYAELGLIPGGAFKNRKYFSNKIYANKFLQELESDIFFDPQTSGGLLISIPKENINKIREFSADYKIIGKAVEKKDRVIKLLWGNYEWFI